MLTKRIKRVKAKPFAFLYGEAETDFAGISASGKKIMNKLMPFMEKRGIAVGGACVWAYEHVGKGRVEIYHKWIGLDSPDNLTELQVQFK